MYISIQQCPSVHNGIFMLNKINEIYNKNDIDL